MINNVKTHPVDTETTGWMTSQAHLADVPPYSDHVTGYDRAHMKTYARLLDAAAEEADWCEVARVVLGLDIVTDVGRARRVYDAHLDRARWVAKIGYRDLLDFPLKS